jgi:hypothetical protein
VASLAAFGRGIRFGPARQIRRITGYNAISCQQAAFFECFREIRQYSFTEFFQFFQIVYFGWLNIMQNKKPHEMLFNSLLTMETYYFIRNRIHGSGKMYSTDKIIIRTIYPLL